MYCLKFVSDIFVFLPDEGDSGSLKASNFHE